ncbi:exodeoxyribonuclease V subunit alpha [Pararobbsia silviterrae]|uniref:RecBCD enzyme subunit RecD n=2 Tax=Pararobbsia silviterrae TaxID=1792498 RepID=A0A494XMQ9_9BURK|nr:exodeoxyribonuclease V subunit alpha [Pararobbsia silviterrae]
MESHRAVRALLAAWVEHGWLRRVDLAFADFLAREVPDAAPLLLLAAALASHQLGRGHACLDLAATLDDPSFALSMPPDDPRARDLDTPAMLPSKVLARVTLAQWCDALSDPALVASGAGDTPLVRVGARVYLRRYWQYEQNVRNGIAARLRQPVAMSDAAHARGLGAALDALFGRAAPDAPRARADWQKLACALAARSAFSIVTGGPGTGKTTTVVKLLALLQSMAISSGHGAAPSRALRIRLAAPTGKAAARLNESIAGAVGGLKLDAFEHADAIRAAIPVAVTTLHRLLGTRADSRRFRHNADAPLSLDVLVIDEASMIDLEMMAAVLDALPPHARLILLGDKDQLASVEAGAVLGELCRRAYDAHYTPPMRAWLETITGERIDDRLVDPDGTLLDQAVVMLRHSHRFKDSSGIGRLASAVNAGSALEFEKVWKHGYGDIAMLDCAHGDDSALRSLVVDGTFRSPHATELDFTAPRDGYRHYLDLMRERRPAYDPDLDAHDRQRAHDAWARDVLRAHGAFQLLCALRRGPWGVEGLNRRIETILEAEGLIDVTSEWYLGRPVLVTRNDYELGLMNGDIGMTLDLPDADGRSRLRVAFAAGDGTDAIKWVLPSRLQSVETVFALTVHKSQGSEFTHAALVLPDAPSPVITRELVYTGITRARAFLTLASAGGQRIVRHALQAQVLRASGLSEGFAFAPASEDR